MKKFKSILAMILNILLLFIPRLLSLLTPSGKQRQRVRKINVNSKRIKKNIEVSKKLEQKRIHFENLKEAK